MDSIGKEDYNVTDSVLLQSPKIAARSVLCFHSA